MAKQPRTQTSSLLYWIYYLSAEDWSELFYKLENPIALYNCNYVYFLQITIDYMKCFCRLAIKITFIKWIANFGSRYQF